jgi:hypothetical protein
MELELKETKKKNVVERKASVLMEIKRERGLLLCLVWRWKEQLWVYWQSGFFSPPMSTFVWSFFFVLVCPWLKTPVLFVAGVHSSSVFWFPRCRYLLKIWAWSYYWRQNWGRVEGLQRSPFLFYFFYFFSFPLYFFQFLSCFSPFLSHVLCVFLLFFLDRGLSLAFIRLENAM